MCDFQIHYIDDDTEVMTPFNNEDLIDINIVTKQVKQTQVFHQIPRTLETKKKDRRIKPYNGKHTLPPSKMAFATFDDHVSYSVAWESKHGKMN